MNYLSCKTKIPALNCFDYDFIWIQYLAIPLPMLNKVLLTNFSYCNANLWFDVERVNILI